tara:strand:- start:875 stop:1051 length:177 start_codon:yes stop_codon:yes gene_type:complete
MDYDTFHKFMHGLFTDFPHIPVWDLLKVARIVNPMPPGYDRWTDDELLDILFDRKKED